MKTAIITSALEAADRFTHPATGIIVAYANGTYVALRPGFSTTVILDFTKSRCPDTNRHIYRDARRLGIRAPELIDLINFCEAHKNLAS